MTIANSQKRFPFSLFAPQNGATLILSVDARGLPIWPEVEITDFGWDRDVSDINGRSSRTPLSFAERTKKQKNVSGNARQKDQQSNQLKMEVEEADHCQKIGPSWSIPLIVDGRIEMFTQAHLTISYL